MAKIWNSIPENLRKRPKHAFKKKIHNLLFLNLQSPGWLSMLILDTLINEIKKGSC